jgi:hypothetical protein
MFACYDFEKLGGLFPQARELWHGKLNEAAPKIPVPDWCPKKQKNRRMMI